MNTGNDSTFDFNPMTPFTGVRSKTDLKFKGTLQKHALPPLSNKFE